MELYKYNICSLIDDVLQNDTRTLREIVAEDCPNFPLAQEVPEGTTMVKVWTALCKGDTDKVDSLCGDFTNARDIAFDAMERQCGLPHDFFEKIRLGDIADAFDLLREDFLNARENFYNKREG